MQTPRAAFYNATRSVSAKLEERRHGTNGESRSSAADRRPRGGAGAAARRLRGRGLRSGARAQGDRRRRRARAQRHESAALARPRGAGPRTSPGRPRPVPAQLAHAAAPSRRHTAQDKRFGATGCSVHRADLLDVLAGDCPTAAKRYDSARAASASKPANRRLARKFQDGTEIEADVIIGADGIHSAVRASIFGPDKPRFTGKICCRWSVPATPSPAAVHQRDNATWLGPHGTMVRVPGAPRRAGQRRLPLRRRELPRGVVDPRVRSAGGLDSYAGWHESLLRLFSASERATSGRCTTATRSPSGPGPRHRAGRRRPPDAPYLGQGACQAMEDGRPGGGAGAVPDEPQRGARATSARGCRAPTASCSQPARAATSNHLVSPGPRSSATSLIAMQEAHRQGPERPQQRLDPGLRRVVRQGAGVLGSDEDPGLKAAVTNGRSPGLGAGVPFLHQIFIRRLATAHTSPLPIGPLSS